MEYRLSADYIEMRRNGPRRMVIMLTSVMAFLGFLAFFGPAAAPNKTEFIVPFGVTVLIVVAIGAFQIRRARGAIAELPSVRYELQGDGISVSSNAGQRHLKYQAIQEIDAYRNWSNADPKLLHLKTTEGQLGLAGLENLGAFLEQVRQRAPNAKFQEKRSMFV